MGLVLEQEQPVLILAVHIALDLDRAGVDLVRLIQVGEDAALFQCLGANGGQVHHAAGLLGAAQLLPQCHIALKGSLHYFVIDLHIGEDGAKGGMTAVIGPVGIDHLDLGDGGVTLLGAEVLLAELDIPQIHS